MAVARRKYVKPTAKKIWPRPGYEVIIKALGTNPEYFKQQVRILTKRAEELGLRGEAGGNALAKQCIRFLLAEGRGPTAAEAAVWAKQYNVSEETMIAILTKKKLTH